jgi:hypothetical protein
VVGVVGLRVIVIHAALVVAIASCTSSAEDSEPRPPDPTSTAAAEPTPTATAVPCDDPPCYGEPRDLGGLDADLVAQPSGMAASWRTPGAFYVVSDLAGTSEIVATTEDGSPIATIEVAGMSAENAEALAVGPCGDPHPDTTCVFIGDIGDHVGRPDVVIYRLPEPDLDAPPTEPVAADVLRYTYPDAPTDAEALIVDHDGRPVIISKAAHLERAIGTTETRVYRGSTGGGVLDHVGTVDLPDPESGIFALVVGNVVTGADSLRDGKVIVRTYDEVLEYRTDDADADVADFATWPVRRVPSPFQVQSETVAYRVDGCGYLTTGERDGSIAAVDCQEDGDG